MSIFQPLITNVSVALGGGGVASINANVLIVGRTKMGGDVRCVGGITEEGRSVRLLSPTGGNLNVHAPYQIGQLWNMTFTPVSLLRAPHVEDVLVTNARFVGVVPDVSSYLLERLSPWRGGIGQVFGGFIRFTGNNNGYVAERIGVPGCSTWFWVSDRDLSLRRDGRHYDYVSSFIQNKGFSYVGEPDPLPVLTAGTLLRVSLARWWRPEDQPDMEERCYLQLSGWF